jgi:putative transposase
LKRYDHYTSAFLETYSWILLPNHFHILAKVKSTESILNYLGNKYSHEICETEKKFLRQIIPIHDLIDNVFQRFLISYAMSFNNVHKRKGNLLHRPFKHVKVNDESQFTQTVIYINANAQKHKIVSDFTKYKWSSYDTIISEKPTKLFRRELLDWFGGKDQFIKTLKEQTKYYYTCDTLLDDD